MAAIEDRVADVYLFARAYVAALDSLQGSDSREFAEYQMRVQTSLHDLALAVRGLCQICDVGTCPGFIT